MTARLSIPASDLCLHLTVALTAEIAGSPQPLKLGQLVNFVSDPEKVALFRKLRRELLDLPPETEKSSASVAEPEPEAEDDDTPYSEFGHEDEVEDFEQQEGPAHEERTASTIPRPQSTCGCISCPLRKEFRCTT